MLGTAVTAAGAQWVLGWVCAGLSALLCSSPQLLDHVLVTSGAEILKESNRHLAKTSGFFRKHPVTGSGYKCLGDETVAWPAVTVFLGLCHC